MLRTRIVRETVFVTGWRIPWQAQHINDSKILTRNPPLCCVKLTNRPNTTCAWIAKTIVISSCLHICEQNRQWCYLWSNVWRKLYIDRHQFSNSAAIKWDYTTFNLQLQVKQVKKIPQTFFASVAFINLQAWLLAEVIHLNETRLQNFPINHCRLTDDTVIHNSVMWY